MLEWKASVPPIEPRGWCTSVGSRSVRPQEDREEVVVELATVIQCRGAFDWS